MKNNSINMSNNMPNNVQVNNTVKNSMPTNGQSNSGMAATMPNVGRNNINMANTVSRVSGTVNVNNSQSVNTTKNSMPSSGQNSVNMTGTMPNINMQNKVPNNEQNGNAMKNSVINWPQNNINVTKPISNTSMQSNAVNNKQDSVTMKNNISSNGQKNVINNAQNIGNAKGNVSEQNAIGTTPTVSSVNMQNNMAGNKQSTNNIKSNVQNNVNVVNTMTTANMQKNITNNRQSANSNIPNNIKNNVNIASNSSSATGQNNTSSNKQINNGQNSTNATNVMQNSNIKNATPNKQANVNNVSNNKTSNVQSTGFNNKLNTKNIDFSRMPVVDAVNQIIITAVNVGASDIHFDPTDDGITVRLRIDGILNDYFFLPFEIKQNATTRIKIMAGMNITETRLPQDGGIRDKINGRDLDLRVSSLPTKRGEKIVIRILDYSMSLQGIEYLYFSETNYNKILKMLNTPNGIILVTGATGTGKSTTLYSFLQKLNVEGTNIITVEDPVEMDIAGINQVQVNSDIGLDFAAVLRSILRQDPNIIMVGEIRDSETAKIAVRASITGHLVLSTIHTNNSLNTIERLLDMDVERYLLASALTGIVSQQLARKLCDKCKTKRDVTTVEKSLFESVLGLDVSEVFEPNKNGCPNCNRGYKGRVALQEVLLINQDIRDAISSGMRKEQLRELVYNKDVITMLQDGLYKVMAGFTTMDEVLKLIEVEDEDFGIK